MHVSLIADPRVATNSGQGRCRSVPVEGPGFTHIVEVNFETTADSIADFILVDPTDSTTLLEGDWAAGMFGATSTTGLSATILWDSGTNTAAFGSGQVGDTGFLQINQSTPYASLVDNGGAESFALNLTTLDNFDDGSGGGLNEIIGDAILSGTLGTFTAEGQGQVYRIESGGFVVPEPGTGLLMLAGLLGLAGMQRRLDA